jgi:glycosyltransferase involved in cell wall biosynthesis
MTRHDLSIVVPAHNAAGTLEAAIGSVLDADGLFEILLVDDGSTDATFERATGLAAALRAAGRPPLRVLTQSQPVGPAAARNLGVAKSEGEILAFLDADDTWLAGVPDPRRAALASGPAVALGLIQPYLGDPPQPSGAPFEGYQVGAALIPRGVFETVGPFESGLALGEDLDWFLRARDTGVPVVFVPEVVLAYRMRAGSLSARRASRGQGLLHALHRSIDRRRSIEDPGP